MNTDPIILIVDLFSGAGGLTTGAERAEVNGRKAAIVIAAVNHDPVAIASHAANHPHAMHFIEDIRTLEMEPLVKVVNEARRQFPDALLMIWASLECTNFSKAKGGLPRDADSRTLADHMDRYILALNPDIFYAENVVEFMSWGPLDERGKPISRTEGRDYIRWINRICSYGYSYDKRILNSANFGAYTSRERFFCQFARPGIPISWPEPTHSRQKNTIWGDTARWKPVREVLDLYDVGQSIFDRKKPYVDNTLERIYAGLVKFVAKGDNYFLQKYYSGRPEGKVIGIDVPAGAQTTTDSHALVCAPYLVKYNSSAADGNKRNSVHPVNDPAPVIATQGRLAVCTPFMTRYNGKSKAHSVECPATTLDTNDRLNVVNAMQFISRDFSNGDNNHSIDKPAGSIPAVPKMNLVTPFLITQNFKNGPRSIDTPAPAVMACRKHQYLVNPQYNNTGNSIHNPSPVIIARSDKRPISLATAIEGEIRWQPMPGDSPVMLRIKQFMKEHNIADIYMRMLHIHELKRIMGFGEQYVLHGSQRLQKKYIGNAVETNQGKANIEAVAMGYTREIKKYA